MPRHEEVVPWAVTEAAKKEPYPRKNLYFIGDGQEVIYDYLIWRANIDEYVTFDGLIARGASEIINDLLRRAFGRDMLDERCAEQFLAWRKDAYSSGGIDARAAEFTFEDSFAAYGTFKIRILRTSAFRREQRNRRRQS